MWLGSIIERPGDTNFIADIKRTVSSQGTVFFSVCGLILHSSNTFIHLSFLSDLHKLFLTRLPPSVAAAAIQIDAGSVVSVERCKALIASRVKWVQCKLDIGTKSVTWKIALCCFHPLISLDYLDFPAASFSEKGKGGERWTSQKGKTPTVLSVL